VRKLGLHAAMILGAVIVPALALPPLYPRLGVVLAPPASRDLLHQCSRQSPYDVNGDWTPSTAQIAELERRLPDALNTALSKRSTNNARAEVIARQYAGFLIGGRKTIYVNAFTKQETTAGAYPHDWRHSAVVVCDGGAVFFGVEYDPEKKTFANFAFNGAV
jgi:hypothetical protein